MLEDEGIAFLGGYVLSDYGGKGDLLNKEKEKISCKRKEHHKAIPVRRGKKH